MPGTAPATGKPVACLGTVRERAPGTATACTAVRLCELMTLLRSARMEPRTLRMVLPRRSARPAKPVLLHAVKGARAGLTVKSLLAIYANDEQAFSEEASVMVE